MRRTNGEALALVHEPHGLGQPPPELGQQQRPGCRRSQASDVDPRDADAARDQVGAILIPEIGVRAAHRESDTAHGREQACCDE